MVNPPNHITKVLSSVIEKSDFLNGKEQIQVNFISNKKIKIGWSYSSQLVTFYVTQTEMGVGKTTSTKMLCHKSIKPH